MRNLLPKGSILHHWLDAQSIVETPESYDLACGCAVIGALMRRDIWYDQVLFKIWPNISVILIGKSGVGKDTAINQAERQIMPFGRVPIINGVSIEAIIGQLAEQQMGNGLLLAKEISSLFGPKDWQSGILTQLTNLMSGGDSVPIALASARNRTIRQPTITFMGGSTIDWLHTHMPDGANEGGFYPRTLMIVEYKNKQSVPLIDRLPAGKLAAAMQAMEQWQEGLRKLVDRYSSHGRFQFASNADAASYERWYEQRFKSFSTFAHAYAHRSRDNCLRLAIHSAMSCGRPFIEQQDVEFGAGMIEYIARRIDVVFAPPTLEAKIAQQMLAMLPASENKITATLAKAYRSRDIDETCRFLMRTRQIVKGTNGDLVKGEID